MTAVHSFDTPVHELPHVVPSVHHGVTPSPRLRGIRLVVKETSGRGGGGGDGGEGEGGGVETAPSEGGGVGAEGYYQGAGLVAAEHFLFGSFFLGGRGERRRAGGGGGQGGRGPGGREAE